MASIVSIEDVSTGIALRRRASAVIDPSEEASLEDVAVETMKATIRAGTECLDKQGRPHFSTFHADVGFVFLYDDPDRVGKGLPVAKAVYVRKGLDRRAVPMLPKGRVRTLELKTDKGTMTLAIERTVA